VPYRLPYDSLSDGLLASAYQTVSPINNYVKNIEGGFVKIGKLVIVNLRCVVNSEIPINTAFISGFPKPIIQYNADYGATALTTNNLAKSIAVSGNGDIRNASDGVLAVNTTMILSTVYMAK